MSREVVQHVSTNSPPPMDGPPHRRVRDDQHVGFNPVAARHHVVGHCGARGLGLLNDLRHIGAKKDPPQRVRRLRAKGHITKGALDAFLRIWGNDRHTFHHVNAAIPTSHADLERRAEECVESLFDIESGVFAFDIKDVKLQPRTPEYWRKSDPEHVNVFLRQSRH